MSRRYATGPSDGDRTAAQLTSEGVMARAKQNFGEWFTEPEGR
jgi:hypothetical protein